ncbi:MAG: Cna B-type domain-containing protein, partial [Eubacteriaceae bacterium]|nr:Cna B-type domain-containing protein [Eubacteriaceae bacterium]
MRKHFKNTIIILLTAVMAFGVIAASLPEGGNDAFAATGDPVHTIANPAGLTLDVFNYTVRDSSGTAVYNGYGPNGINANHALKFSNGQSNSGAITGFNLLTGGGNGVYTPCIVERNLKDGYPYLSSAVTNSPESLKYLFDDSNIYNNGNTNNPNKVSYMGCDELFTVDEAGYYVFESDKYKAVLNTQTKKFTVTENANAEFYPFGDVSSSVHDYHFGLHMQSEFSVPQNGVVLNPSGEYEEMIFSFVGDDDVWLYIDGILIGDVGGVHDAQDLDINFATGTVVVKNHENGTHRHETTIYKQVVAAYKEKYPEDSDEEITAKVMHDFRWDDTKVDGDGNPVTFAPGTYHTMDFYYLERGAGKSNLKIRYNFVSTYDFTAHKSLYRGNKDNEKPLAENQFHFKLTALRNEEYPELDPVMPKVRPDNDVDWEPHYDAEPKYLIAGNALDGNVNFGNANLKGDPDDPATELGLYALKTFRYIYEELPPDGAVLNADGSYTYKGGIVPKNPDGSYTFDGITYYLEKYYFEGTVSREGWINKTYYTDETFTHKAAGVYFADFSNFYDSVGRASISANKELQDLEGNKIPLETNQFHFNLRQITDSATPYVQNGVGCASDGSVYFSPIVYSLKDLDGANQKVFTYEITEDVPGPADDDYDENATYSQDVYYAVVTVTDPGEGQSLTVTTEYYKGSVAAANKVDAAAVKFINKYDVTESTVKKVWNDNNNQNGNRPDSISVTFEANGEPVETYTLNGDNNWTLTLSNLPKKAGGADIVYTWVEESVPTGYVSAYNTVGSVTTITNTPDTTEATVKKVWNDANNQDGKRPETLTVKLSNGTPVTLNEANGWTATVKNLPKYADGVEIKYTWSEENVPAGYTLESNTTDGTITTITNKHIPETTEATVKKVWDDANNQDGKRPTSLKVTLSNGTEVTLNDGNNWTATINDLPKYAGGVEIPYSWTEEDLTSLGYTQGEAVVNGTVTTFTNSYTPEKTSATVKKVWEDANNQDGKRPTSLKVTLSNGTEVTLSDGNNWTATINDLPKYADGVEIKYTWTEESLPEGYKLESSVTVGTVTTITNKHVPEKTEATVKKEWNDADNQDGIRPESLEVKLSNGAKVTLNEENSWTATVTDLPKYADGVEIKYTWTEESLPEGYKLESS